MSSYRSGQYYVELNRRLEIENRCKAELDLAVRRMEQAVKKKLEVDEKPAALLRRRKEEQTRQTERYITSLAQQKEKDRAQKSSIEQELRSVRLQYDAILKAYGIKKQANDPVALLEKSVLQIDDLEYAMEKVDEFRQMVLPQLERQYAQRAEEPRIADLRGIDLAAPTGQEIGGDIFVSLKQEFYSAQPDSGKWEVFRHQLEEMLQYGEYLSFYEELAALHSRAARVTAQERESFQNAFLPQWSRWMEEYQRVCEALAEREETAQEDYLNYLAIAGLLQLEPDTAMRNAPERCRRETERLWDQYLRRSEQQYIRHTVVEVFRMFGIDAQDSMESTADAIHFSVEPPLGLTLTKRPSGAFEIESYAITNRNELSSDERRSYLEAAGRVCSSIDAIEQELAKRGVLIKDESILPLREDAILLRSSQNGRSAAKGYEAAKSGLERER